MGHRCSEPAYQAPFFYRLYLYLPLNGAVAALKERSAASYRGSYEDVFEGCYRGSFHSARFLLRPAYFPYLYCGTSSLAAAPEAPSLALGSLGKDLMSDSYTCSRCVLDLDIEELRFGASPGNPAVGLDISCSRPCREDLCGKQLLGRLLAALLSLILLICSLLCSGLPPAFLLCFSFFPLE